MSSALLQAIKCLSEAAYKAGRVIVGSIARRLSHVDDLVVIEFTIEISTFDINLVNLHTLVCC